ncbi:hypothetical protein [Rhodococcus sp. NPDC047139]|uniref:hypothetical protein n=1 Tax=Rhodococcus sp. NPDC047139 TaxID=3155141 RepID=UPI0033E967C0
MPKLVLGLSWPETCELRWYFHQKRRSHPRLRRGVVIAAVLATAFVLFGIINDMSDGLEAPSEGDASTTPKSSGHSAAAHSLTSSGATAATTARTASPPRLPLRYRP